MHQLLNMTLYLCMKQKYGNSKTMNTNRKNIHGQNKVLRTAYKGKEKVQYFSGTYQDLQQKTLSYVFAAYTVESYRNIARTSQRIRPNKSMDNLQQVQ